MPILFSIDIFLLSRMFIDMHSASQKHVLQLAAAGLTTLRLSGLVAPSASASVYNSSLSGVRTGFTSTRVSHNGGAIQVGLAGCRTGVPKQNSKIEIEARQDNSFKPDRSLGNRNVKECMTSPVRASWGNQQSGKYFMKVHSWEWQNTSASAFNIYY